MFEVGQKVQCIKRGGWKDSQPWSSGPTYGEVVLVVGVRRAKGQWFLRLHGYDVLFASFWSARYFRPLTEDPEAVQETVEKHFSHHLKQGELV